jgi:hypothetical protein
MAKLPYYPPLRGMQRFASAAIAWISIHLTLGCLNSKKKTFVFSFYCIGKFDGSDGSTKVVVIPSRGKVVCNKLNVPPNTWATMWSPVF